MFTIANNYISANPVKSLFLAHVFFQFFERAIATLRGLAGHFWPAGHRLGTAAQFNLQIKE